MAPLRTVVTLALFLALASGLRPSYRRHILEFHNTVRAEVASGNITLPSIRAVVPQASGMRVFEWWPRLATEAARIAKEECDGVDVVSFEATDVDVFVAQKRSVRAPANASIAQLLYNITDLTRSPSFGDQPLVDEDMVRLGCDLRHCSSDQIMVCVYASERLTERPASERPYSVGPPCSACPTGNDYCMNGILCATAEQCNGRSMSRCTCVVNQTRCEDDGGEFDATACQCLCGLRKSKGLYCGTPCRDSGCSLESRKEKKKEGDEEADRPEACYKTDASTRLLVMAKCRRTCNRCRQDALDSLDRTGPGVPINIYTNRDYLNRAWVVRRGNMTSDDAAED